MDEHNLSQTKPKPRVQIAWFYLYKVQIAGKSINIVKSEDNGMIFLGEGRIQGVSGMLEMLLLVIGAEYTYEFT